LRQEKVRQILTLHHRDQEYTPGAARTCLACRRLHSLQSPCPYRGNVYVSAVRQWEAGLFLDEVLAPHVRVKAAEIAGQCRAYVQDLT
jgi:hypothetical protein